MKKNVMLTFALLMSIMSWGQSGNQEPAKAATNQTDEMKSVLSLNDTQYTAVRDINQKYAEKIGAIHKDAQSAHDKQRDEIKSLKNQRDKDLKTVLSPEQQTKWEGYRMGKKEARHNRHGKHHGRGHHRDHGGHHGKHGR
jgi:hypothetical protein